MATKKKTSRKTVSNEVLAYVPKRIEQAIDKRCLKALHGAIEQGLDERWTPNASGDVASARALVEAFGAFVRNHPSKISKKKIKLTDLDVSNARLVVNAVARKRGRVSSYDRLMIESLMRINEAAGRSNARMGSLIKLTKKRGSKKDRSAIKLNARDYRSALITYFETTQPPKAKEKALTFHRDKALIMMLMHLPFRLSTLVAMRKSWIHGSEVRLPLDSLKTREEVTAKLPSKVLKAIEEYRAVCPHSSDKLFLGRRGEELKPNSIYKALVRRSMKILNVQIGTHDGRRVTATAVSSLLGTETAANLLIIDQKTLAKHYDLRDTSDRLNDSVARLEAL